MTQFNNQFRSEFGRQNESFSCIVDSIRNKEANKKWTAYSISWESFKSLSHFMLKSNALSVERHRRKEGEEKTSKKEQQGIWNE